MIETIHYIIQFLLGENVPTEISDEVGYTSNPDEYSHYKVVIHPSGFFDDKSYGTKESLPKLPLPVWEEVPVLFGQNTEEKQEDTIIIHADIIASTYFLISRYEEYISREIRDEHGRFRGQESLPNRAGFIDTPVVDEYGKILRQKLRNAGVAVPEPPLMIKKIFLTHDVDQIAHYRNIRGMVGGFLRGFKRKNERREALMSFFLGVKHDPWFTFPWLFNKDSALIKMLGTRRCESITFFRAGGGTRKEDKPAAKLLFPDYRTLIKYCKRKGVSIGLHLSYEAGILPELIFEEKEKLDRLAGIKTVFNRNHYLCSREPEDMQYLIDAGITDDFTMSYADMAGFRLGTCRPVKWINPVTKKTGELVLHPLAIMDSSLSEKKYMYMNAHDAYKYTVQLINYVEKYNGELVLLWHNTSVEDKPQSYHRQLYEDIIEYLKQK